MYHFFKSDLSIFTHKFIVDEQKKVCIGLKTTKNDKILWFLCQFWRPLLNFDLI